MIKNEDLLPILDENPYWRDDARCGVDPEKWHPEPGEHSLEERRICLQECPVRRQCLASAFREEERYGVWGGLTTTALRKALRERSRAWRAGVSPKSVDHYLANAQSDLDRRVEDTFEQADIDLHIWANSDGEP